MNVYLVALVVTFFIFLGIVILKYKYPFSFKQNKKKIISIIGVGLLVTSGLLMIPTDTPPEGDEPGDTKPIEKIEPYIFKHYKAEPDAVFQYDYTAKYINKSFYRNFLNETISYKCEKSVDNVTWKDADKCLVVEKNWDGFNKTRKDTIIIVSDEDAYYRLSLKTDKDKDMKNFEDKSIEAYYNFDFKLSNNDWYNISYDWNDFIVTPEYTKASIEKQVTSDTSNKKQFEWDVYTTVKIAKGDKYVIDPSWGTAVDGSHTFYDLSMCRLSDTTFASAWVDTTFDGWVAHGTVSDTTITVDDNWEFESGDIYAAGRGSIGLAMSQDDVVCVAYLDDNQGDDGYLQILEYSGDGWSSDETAEFETGDAEHMYVAPLITSDKFLICYNDEGNSNTAQGVVYDWVDFGSSTLGSVNDVASTDYWSRSGDAFGNGANQAVYIFFGEDANDIFMAHATISTRTIGWGSVVSPYTGTAYFDSGINGDSYTTDEFVIVYTLDGGSNMPVYARVCTVSGNTITMGDQTTIVEDGCTAAVAVAMTDDSHCLVVVEENMYGVTYYCDVNFDDRTISPGEGEQFHNNSITNSLLGDTQPFDIIRLADNHVVIGFENGADGNNLYYIAGTIEAEEWSNSNCTISDETPSNTSTDIGLNRRCSAIVQDADTNHTMNVTFASNKTGSWVNYQTNRTVSNNTNCSWDMSIFNSGNTKYWWKVYAMDGQLNVSEVYSFTTKANGSLTIYNTTIRNSGIDYFTYLGGNITASNFDGNITGFDEAAEYIATWTNTSWSASDGCWVKWYGDGTGTDFNLSTFDIICIYLTDSGNQTINMTENENIPSYTNSKAYTFTNHSLNQGYNYTSYNREAVTTLSTVNTSIGLESGEFLALWNQTNYNWDYWIVGFWEPSTNIHRWAVIVTKVEDTETYNT